MTNDENENELREALRELADQSCRVELLTAKIAALRVIAEIDGELANEQLLPRLIPDRVHLALSELFQCARRAWIVVKEC